MSYKKVKATSDNDGHNYLIPNELYELFESQLEESEENDEYEEFEDLFGRYQTNGSINNVQLYIKEE